MKIEKRQLETESCSLETIYLIVLTYCFVGFNGPLKQYSRQSRAVTHIFNLHSVSIPTSSSSIFFFSFFISS